MVTENTTPNQGYQEPHSDNNLSDDVLRLVTAFRTIDSDVASAFAQIALKAGLVHSHQIENINGLQSALDGKAAAGHAHSLNNLSDVDVSTSTTLQVLMKSATGWIPSKIDGSHILTGTINLDRLPTITEAKLPTVLADTTASFTTTLKTKLDGIEAGADKTDEANVKAALDGATIPAATVADDYKLLLQNTSDLDKLITVTVQEILDLVPGVPAWIESYATGASSTTSTIPSDDTIPQITEGQGIVTISNVVVAAGEKVEIEFNAYMSSASNIDMVVAIFRSGTNNALNVEGQYGSFESTVRGAFVDTPAAGTYTYSLRYGASSGTTYLNSNAGTRKYGGKLRSGLRLRVLPA